MADKGDGPKEPKEVSYLYLPIIIQVPCVGDPRHLLPPWSATGRHALVFVPGDGDAQDPTALRRLHGPHQVPHLQDQMCVVLFAMYRRLAGSLRQCLI